MNTAQDLKITWKNVPTRTITAGGVKFAYRELGTNNPGTPVLARLKERSENRDKASLRATSTSRPRGC